MLWKIILPVTIVVFSTIILFSKHGCVFCLCLVLFLFFANPAPHHVFFPHSFHYTFWTLYPLINKLSFLFFFPLHTLHLIVIMAIRFFLSCILRERLFFFTCSFRCKLEFQMYLMYLMSKCCLLHLASSIFCKVALFL